MLKQISLIGVVVLGSAAAAGEECIAPEIDFSILPDGNTASRETMIDAASAVRGHSIKVNAYLDYLDENQEYQFTFMNNEQQQHWIEEYQGMVDSLRALEEGYNAQVRIFNKKNPSTTARSEQSHDGALYCSTSQINLRNVNHRIDYDYLYITGFIQNNCPFSTGVEVKITVVGAISGTERNVITSRNLWPASTNNILPSQEYPFETMIRFDERIRDSLSWWDYDILVTGVKEW